MVFTSRDESTEQKNNNFTFDLKNTFLLSGMKNSSKNISDSGRKWFPVVRKSVPLA